MGEMMELSAANAMDFGIAEAELYTMHADNSSGKFHRLPQDHIEEYVGGMTAETRKANTKHQYNVVLLL